MRYILGFLAILTLAGSSFAQAPAPTSTTLTQALTGPSPQTGANTIMGNTVFLASRTGVIAPIVPGTTAVLLYVDREAMAVQSVNPNTGGITVERGYLSTQPTAHNSGATVLYGRTDIAAQTVFYTFDPAGACVSTNAPNPWINVLTATQWSCTNGVWVTSASVYGTGLPAGCTSPASAQLKCSIFIDTTSVTNVGASAQALNLYVSGGCDGISACTGNFVGFLAPASVAASLQFTLPTVDACGAYGSLVSDAAQHLSFNCGPARIITADWTCGTGGTVASCVAAQTIGTLTFTLPLLARSWTIDCNGVVGQATGVTANSWNIQTATNGATNLTANYLMATAATAMTGGAVTDVASTTTTQVIAPTWTLGGTGTKMPFHIWATVEGVSASGTVVNIQLVAPTVGDLVTIYRGASCSAY